MDVRLLDDFGVWDWGVSGVDVWGLDCFRGCCLVKWVCLRQECGVWVDSVGDWGYFGVQYVDFDVKQ